MAFLSLILFFAFMVSAHFDSGFSAKNAKPTSLAYVLDTDEKSASWVTYEKVPSAWTEQFFERKKAPEKLKENSLSSKYSTSFTFTAEAPLKDLSPLKLKRQETRLSETNASLKSA